MSTVNYQIPMNLRKRLYSIGKGEVCENDLVVTAIKVYVDKVKPKKYKVQYTDPDFPAGKDNLFTSVGRYKSLANFNRQNPGMKGLKLIGKSK